MMGLPSFTYNPLNDNNLIASMQVLPKSTYVNYKLKDHHIDYLNNPHY